VVGENAAVRLELAPDDRRHFAATLGSTGGSIAPAIGVRASTTTFRGETAENVDGNDEPPQLSTNRSPGRLRPSRETPSSCRAGRRPPLALCRGSHTARTRLAAGPSAATPDDSFTPQ